MKSMHRKLVLGFTACALAAMSIGAWSQPLGVSGSLVAPVQEQQPAPGTPDQTKSMTFSGTVAKKGNGFILRDSSGAVYRLDDSSRAARFEGKSVTVTGKLDPQTKTIHVETIEGASA